EAAFVRSQGMDARGDPDEPDALLLASASNDAAITDDRTLVHPAATAPRRRTRERTGRCAAACSALAFGRRPHAPVMRDGFHRIGNLCEAGFVFVVVELGDR